LPKADKFSLNQTGFDYSPKNALLNNMTDEIQPIASQNFGFNSIGNSVANADKLESIGGSYALSAILLSAVELNVFDCLVDESKTCDRIATEIQVAPDALKQ
jgi:Dimerisation domain